MTIRALANQLDLTIGIIGHHMRMLQDAGVIRRLRDQPRRDDGR